MGTRKIRGQRCRRGLRGRTFHPPLPCLAGWVSDWDCRGRPSRTSRTYAFRGNPSCARNPRTAARELPRGAMSVREAAAFVAVSSAAFVAVCAPLGPVCLALSPVALAIVFWYSIAKRVTHMTQLFLGLAMAVAPVGGWIAAGGGWAWEPALLGLAIGAWVGGFDVLYACQDLEFDRRHGLHSIPVRFGVRGALAISRAMHLLAVACLAALGAVADLGPIYLAGVVVVAGLLFYEQSLVSADDLSQVKRAFDLNGYVGLFYLLATGVALYVG